MILPGNYVTGMRLFLGPSGIERFLVDVSKAKTCTVTYEFLHLPKNYYGCQMIAVKKSQYIAVCVVHS